MVAVLPPTDVPTESHVLPCSVPLVLLKKTVGDMSVERPSPRQRTVVPGDADDGLSFPPCGEWVHVVLLSS